MASSSGMYAVSHSTWGRLWAFQVKSDDMKKWLVLDGYQGCERLEALFTSDLYLLLISFFFFFLLSFIKFSNMC